MQPSRAEALCVLQAVQAQRGSGQVFRGCRLQVRHQQHRLRIRPCQHRRQGLAQAGGRAQVDKPS